MDERFYERLSKRLCQILGARLIEWLVVSFIERLVRCEMYFQSLLID